MNFAQTISKNIFKTRTRKTRAVCPVKRKRSPSSDESSDDESEASDAPKSSDDRACVSVDFAGNLKFEFLCGITLVLFSDRKKYQTIYCSYFFVFQSYELRFSGIFGPVLIRSFPVCFVKKSFPRGVPREWKVDQNITLLNFMKFHSNSGVSLLFRYTE